MQEIREYVIVKNRQIVLDLPDDFDASEAEVIVLPRRVSDTQTASPKIPAKKTRHLGILKGKADCRIKDDFKMSDEELLC